MKGIFIPEHLFKPYECFFPLKQLVAYSCGYTDKESHTILLSKRIKEMVKEEGLDEVCIVYPIDTRVHEEYSFTPSVFTVEELIKIFTDNGVKVIPANGKIKDFDNLVTQAQEFLNNHFPVWVSDPDREKPTAFPLTDDQVFSWFGGLSEDMSRKGKEKILEWLEIRSKLLSKKEQLTLSTSSRRLWGS